MSGKACVFAGQGAQAVGMGKDLAEAYPESRALFAKADEVLGFPLSKLCFEGPIEDLTKSSNCQPAIFVMSMACFAALRKARGDVTFQATAGLSLGEWTALHMAGSLSFEDTLRVLQVRGAYMQEACEAREGGMVSVLGLALDKLQAVCAATGVEMANLNSTEQIVLSGEKRAIEQAEKLAKEAGAKRTVLLKVAGAFHSSLMKPAADRLEQYLAGVTFRAPQVPVVANVTGRPHGGPDEIRRTMVQQVTSSVRWFAGIEYLKSTGIASYVEFGPGNVLSGLIKRIDKDATASNIQDVPSLQKLAAG